MKARNPLLRAPPYQVERALKKLGTGLKTARLRRSLTAEEVARKIGTSRFTVADAERGKPSTGIAVYAALMWTFGFIERLSDLADPNTDEEGSTLALARGPARARQPRRLNNEF
jgi:DNA-binding XRE family transcriptional regulator